MNPKLFFISSLLFVFIFNTNAYSQFVQKSEAEKIAIQFASNRLNAKNLENFNNEYSVKYKDEIVYYVFNLNPEGFVIVSADKATVPILAYSYDGFCPENTNNESYKWWMSRYSEIICSARKNELSNKKDFSNLWDSYSKGDIAKVKSKVEPLVTTKWGQGVFYNEFCPADETSNYDKKCVTGCVATAIGQLMNYFRWPKSGEGVYTSEYLVYGEHTVDYSSANYNFNEMANQIGNRSNPEIAELLYHIGVGVDMNYGPKGSGMTNHKGAHVMKTFFKYVDSTKYIFRDSISYNWDSTIISFLNKKIPLYYAGWSDYDYIMGHAYVVDGYQDSAYFHFNWGWNGTSDGYFHSMNMYPAGNNFNLMQELIINMYPEDGYPYYCNGEETITSLDGTIDDGSGPLFNYNNNTNCSWLIAPENDSVSKITLTFHRFETEEGEDILTIYDGATTDSPVLGTFSGSTLPQSIESSGNKILIKFVSNASNTFDGFLISYSAKTPTYCTPLVVLTADSGTIEDGSGSFNYHGNSNCRWRINTSSDKPILLTFHEFDLDSTDYVKVQNQTTGEVLGNFTGTNLPPVLYSANGTMLITFYASATKHAQGFKASYRASEVAVSEFDKQNFIIFPNPADDELFISNIDLNNSEIRVYDTNGKLVIQKTSIQKSGNEKLDISKLSKGLYFITISNDSKILSNKFLKE